jgi:hypothetical protein
VTLHHEQQRDERRAGTWHCTLCIVRDPRPFRMPPRRAGMSVFVTDAAAPYAEPALEARKPEIDAMVSFRAWQLRHIARAWPLVRLPLRRLRGAS